MSDETSVIELLHSTPVSDADLTALIEGGTRRGRAALRRRRAVASLSAAAFVGVIGVTATVVPSLLAEPPASAPIAVAPTSSDSVAPDPDHPRELIDPSQMAVTLATLVPGEATDLQNWHGNDYQAASVLLDGERVDLLVEQTWSDVDQAKAEQLNDELDSPEEMCVREASVAGGGACRQVAAGWLRTVQIAETEQGQPKGIVGNHAILWTADGWTVRVTAYNASGEKNTDPVSDAPVLTLAQATQVAVSDAWFI